MTEKNLWKIKIMDSPAIFVTSVIRIKGSDARIRLAFHSLLEIYY